MKFLALNFGMLHSGTTPKKTKPEYASSHEEKGAKTFGCRDYLFDIG